LIAFATRLISDFYAVGLWRPADVAVLCGGFQSGGIRSPSR
jgi:hypothetical protein